MTAIDCIFNSIVESTLSGDGRFSFTNREDANGVIIRYDLEDVSDNHRLPHVVWTQLEADLNVRQHDILRARYDARVFLDERESTLRRVPNPEHWLWVEYVFRF